LDPLSRFKYKILKSNEINFSFNVKAPHGVGVPSFILKNVSDFRLINCGDLPGKQIGKAVDLKL
jgi:hypothetical protein